MRFNTLKLTGILSLAGLVSCGGYRMSYYGVSGDRPSTSAAPACGLDADLRTEFFIALNKEEFKELQGSDSNPNHNPVCNKCVKISYKNKWTFGRIIDSCPGCPRKGLDVSPTLFKTFTDLKEGIIYMDWEYTDCSQLGKSGTCSNGKCTTSSSSSSGSSGSSGSSDKAKTTKRKTTTTKRYTTTTKKAVTTKAKPTTALPKTLTASKIASGKPLPTNGGVPLSAANSKVPNTKPVKSSNTNTAAGTNQSNQTNDKTISSSVTEKEGKNVLLPLTGALIVSGAAGVGLLYAKRNNNLSDLKEKFPEAFSNIKRSISRGSTTIRRGFSESSKALKRSLSRKNTNDTTGPHIRTKKEYRESLDAHYPLQPVQLYDPPMNYNTNGYSSLPRNGDQQSQTNNYHLQQCNSREEGGNDLQVDFHDSYY